MMIVTPLALDISGVMKITINKIKIKLGFTEKLRIITNIYLTDILFQNMLFMKGNLLLFNLFLKNKSTMLNVLINQNQLIILWM